MCIDAKSAPCWTSLPENVQTKFPPGPIFQQIWKALTTGASFIKFQCTRSERRLPIIMELNKNHQITLQKGRNGFSFLDVVAWNEPKYQIQSPYEFTSAIISSDERYNDCFLLQSTARDQLTDDFQQIIHGHKDSFLQQSNSIRQCISADARID